MKTNKIIYWASTSLIALGMLSSVFLQYFTQEMIDAYKHMGFPDFLRIEIAIAKIIGVIVLLTPQFSNKIKQWAYAGFGILFFNASLTHYLVSDPTERVVTPIIFLVLLIVSNIYYSKSKN